MPRYRPIPSSNRFALTFVVYSPPLMNSRYEGEQAMRLEKAQHTANARTMCTFGPLSRLLCVVFTTAAALMPPATVLAQQPARMDAQATKAVKAGGVGDKSIRPFRVNVPPAALIDLRRRIAATKWPGRETVADASQGVQLATMQKLARYWAKDYDWRKFEARLNALPQFTTEIDGLDIHFIHVRSKHANALPLIITHGWPGSIVEQLKIIEPLTDPTVHGGSAADAFDVVIPSMPGYGFSGKPTSIGWGPERMGRAWATLMQRLGYTRYVAQGGDWGAFVVDQMGLQAPAGLLAI